MKITNHDLHVMLTEIKGDVKCLVEKSRENVEWQREHENKDEQRFGSLNRYAISIAIVASAIGACGAWIWGKITG